MKRKIILLICVLLFAVLLASCADDDAEQNKGPLNKGDGTSEDLTDFVVPDPGTYEYDGATPVYVIINSHNEDSWNVGTEEKYLDYREDLLERIDIIHSFGAKLNWQTDYTVVEAMIEYENEDIYDDTGGMNVLQYMNSIGVSIDPHTHSSNFADVVYLVEQLDAEASGVIGGIRAFTCADPLPGYMDWLEDLEIEEDGYVYGRDYPDAKWKPEILSGAGFGGHWYDDHTSGVWRPGNEDQFYEHDPNAQIIYIGQGYAHDTLNIGPEHSSGAPVVSSEGEYIKELVSLIENGQVPSGRMYTALIHIRDTATVRSGDGAVTVSEGIAAMLGELEELHEAGKIVYVTYQEAADIWETTYNEEMNQLGFEYFSMYDEHLENAEEYCSGQRKGNSRPAAAFK